MTSTAFRSTFQQLWEFQHVYGWKQKSATCSKGVHTLTFVTSEGTTFSEEGVDLGSVCEKMLVKVLADNARCAAAEAAYTTKNDDLFAWCMSHGAKVEFAVSNMSCSETSPEQYSATGTLKIGDKEFKQQFDTWDEAVIRRSLLLKAHAELCA